jgi:hypothetical protein
MIDLNGERKRRRGLADDGRCPVCDHWRAICHKMMCDRLNLNAR